MSQWKSGVVRHIQALLWKRGLNSKPRTSEQSVLSSAPRDSSTLASSKRPEFVFTSRDLSSLPINRLGFEWLNFPVSALERSPWVKGLSSHKTWENVLFRGLVGSDGPQQTTECAGISARFQFESDGGHAEIQGRILTHWHWCHHCASWWCFSVIKTPMPSTDYYSTQKTRDPSDPKLFSRNWSRSLFGGSFSVSDTFLFCFPIGHSRKSETHFKKLVLVFRSWTIFFASNPTNGSWKISHWSKLYSRNRSLSLGSGDWRLSCFLILFSGVLLSLGIGPFGTPETTNMAWRGVQQTPLNHWRGENVSCTKALAKVFSLFPSTRIRPQQSPAFTSFSCSSTFSSLVCFSCRRVMHRRARLMMMMLSMLMPPDQNSVNSSVDQHFSSSHKVFTPTTLASFVPRENCGEVVARPVFRLLPEKLQPLRPKWGSYTMPVQDPFHHQEQGYRTDFFSPYRQGGCCCFALFCGVSYMSLHMNFLFSCRWTEHPPSWWPAARASPHHPLRDPDAHQLQAVLLQRPVCHHAVQHAEGSSHSNPERPGGYDLAPRSCSKRSWRSTTPLLGPGPHCGDVQIEGDGNGITVLWHDSSGSGWAPETQMPRWTGEIHKTGETTD